MNPVVIRPSSGPGFADCARRAAARLFRELIEGAGFQLRRCDRTAGAAVGVSVHRGAAFLLGEKMLGGAPAETLVIEAAVAEFDASTTKEGIVYDDTTTSRPVAQRQIERMTRSYARQVAPQIDPIAVEERLEADLGDGFILSGQADQVAREPDALRDLKTGKIQRANAVQYGLYSMLLRSHGLETKVIIEDFVPRVALQKQQPDPLSVQIPVGPAEWEAHELIGEIKRSVAEFIRRYHEGDAPMESAFRANPQSQLCSARYCPAHSTNFCRLHRGAQ